MRRSFRSRTRSPASPHGPSRRYRAPSVRPYGADQAPRCLTMRAAQLTLTARGVESDGGLCSALSRARGAANALGDSRSRGALRSAPLHEPPRDRRSHAGEGARLVRLSSHNEIVPIPWSLLSGAHSRRRYLPGSRPESLSGSAVAASFAGPQERAPRPRRPSAPCLLYTSPSPRDRS